MSTSEWENLPVSLEWLGKRILSLKHKKRIEGVSRYDVSEELARYTKMYVRLRDQQTHWAQEIDRQRLEATIKRIQLDIHNG